MQQCYKKKVVGYFRLLSICCTDLEVDSKCELKVLKLKCTHFVIGNS